MKTKFNKIYVPGISYFLVVLFVYTAVSKLLDIGIFQSQMAQSEMLQPYTNLLSWLVPLSELVLAGLLLSKPTRSIGLMGSFVLMLGFSFYVYLIMTYSPSLPCSCGGILQEMDWPAHLIFNLSVSLLTGLAWFMTRQPGYGLAWISLGSASMMGLIALMFIFRPKPEVLLDDNFTRHYQDLRLTEKQVFPLAYNSYYIAGINDSTVYLGNSTGFTHGLQVDIHTGERQDVSIQIPQAPEEFAALPKWQVWENDFYIGEGVSPSLYKGKVGDWIAEEFMEVIPYFNEWVVIDTTEFLLRALQASTKKYVLATYHNDEPYVGLHDVLEQESENLFQADGELIWQASAQKWIYLYFYRNKMIIGDMDFEEIKNIPLLYSLDHSNFKTHRGRNETYLRENPVAVLQDIIRIHNDLYFVRSQVMGEGEQKNEFLSQHTIDVYSLAEYQYSFALPYYQGEKARDYNITDQYIIVLYPTSLVVYEHNKLIMAMDEQEKPNT